MALGVALIALGLFAIGEVGAALAQLGGGLVLMFIGVAMLGGRFVPPLASVLGWPIERLRGVTGRLARENSQRHPGRTATTAAALMIGVALVVFVGVFSSSLKASVNETLDDQFAGDLSILNKDGFSPIPSGIADEVADIEGVEVVAPIASVPGGDRGHGRRPAPRRARRLPPRRREPRLGRRLRRNAGGARR